MRCHLYLRKGKVFIPTFGRVPGGPYRDIEPVAVVDVSNAEDLRRAFRETIARGNPPIGPYPRPNPPPVVVKYAGVKSWRGVRARRVALEYRGRERNLSNHRPSKNSGWLGGRPRADNQIPGGNDAGSGDRSHDRYPAGGSAAIAAVASVGRARALF